MQVRARSRSVKLTECCVVERQWRLHATGFRPASHSVSEPRTCRVCRAHLCEIVSLCEYTVYNTPY